MSDKVFDDNIIEGEEEEGEEIEDVESAVPNVTSGEEIEGEEEEGEEEEGEAEEGGIKNTTEGEEIEGEEEEEGEAKEDGEETKAGEEEAGGADKTRIIEQEGEAPETPQRPSKKPMKTSVAPARYTRVDTPSGKKMSELNREMCAAFDQKIVSINTQISKALGVVDTNLTSQVFVATQNTTKNLKASNNDLQKVFSLCAYTPQ